MLDLHVIFAEVFYNVCSCCRTDNCTRSPEFRDSKVERDHIYPDWFILGLVLVFYDVTVYRDRQCLRWRTHVWTPKSILSGIFLHLVLTIPSLWITQGRHPIWVFEGLLPNMVGRVSVPYLKVKNYEPLPPPSLLLAWEVALSHCRKVILPDSWI